MALKRLNQLIRGDAHNCCHLLTGAGLGGCAWLVPRLTGKRQGKSALGKGVSQKSPVLGQQARPPAWDPHDGLPAVGVIPSPRRPPDPGRPSPPPAAPPTPRY